MMLQVIAVLAGISASQSLGYAPGARVQLQTDHQRGYAAVWYDSADKYIGDGYSYGATGHLRLGGRWFAGPGIAASHTSASQWDKTSVRPAAVAGWRTSWVQAWGTTYLWDTSQSRLRGVEATFQGYIGRLVLQPSVGWFAFNQGRGWSAKLMLGAKGVVR